MLSPLKNSMFIRTLLVLIAFGLLAVFMLSYRTQSYALPTASFGGVSLRLELATTTETQERGLGGRTSIPDDYGMLFVFAHEDYWGFWMKDTRIPLDMFWLDAQGHVVWMEQDVATSTYPAVFYPQVPALYVLETNAGFAAAHNIATGTPLVVPTGLINLP